MARGYLLLIEPESDTAAFMRHMLTRAGYRVEHAPSGKEGLISAWRDQPDTIILELDLPDIEGLEVVRRLRSDHRTSGKNIVALTTRTGAASTEAALEVGVDHYLVKQTDAVDLLLRTLAQDTGELESGGTQPIRPGRVLAFMGSKGGVGTSSLCLNVAHTIADSAEHPTAVVDLVLPLGYLSRITGETSPIDIVHLTAQVEPGRLTPEYLRDNLKTPKSWAFHLVPGARDPAQGAKLHADRLAPVIQTLRATYQLVIVDLGRTLSPLTLLVLRQTDVVTMVFSPDPGVVGSTQAVLRYLEDQGIPRERFFLLSNRPLGAEDMSAEELENSLNRAPDGAVPHLGPNMVLANRLHAPLSLRFPQETGTRRVAELAHKLLARQSELVTPIPS
jgi:pilus assembly protein CpaE